MGRERRGGTSEGVVALVPEIILGTEENSAHLSFPDVAVVSSSPRISRACKPQPSAPSAHPPRETRRAHSATCIHSPRMLIIARDNWASDAVIQVESLTTALGILQSSHSCISCKKSATKRCKECLKPACCLTTALRSVSRVTGNHTRIDAVK